MVHISVSVVIMYNNDGEVQWVGKLHIILVIPLKHSTTPGFTLARKMSYRISINITEVEEM